MTLSEWFLVFLVVQCVHFLGTWKLYKIAGRKSWEAAVPIYNAYVLTKIMSRHWAWVILLFIPVVNLIMLPIYWVETIRSFGKNRTIDTLLVVLTLGGYIYYLNYFDTNLVHVKERSLVPKTSTGEWVNSILYAIVAATLVHTYVMQPFTIPTSSLEKTLLVGDYLFVSKFHYGARLPMTEVSFPMVHDTIPIAQKRSYLKKPQIPYFRLPGFQKVKRSDIVVFNWPCDTVTQFFVKNGIRADKPIDKKSNYVKRCVGIAGDTLQITDGKVFVNNKPLQLPQKAKPQYSYKVVSNGEPLNLWALYKKYDLTDRIEYRVKDRSNRVLSTAITYNSQYGRDAAIKSVDNIYYFSALTENAADRLSKNRNIISVTRVVTPKSVSHGNYIFPNNGYGNWNQDQMGPLYIPKKGASISLTTENLEIYRRVIEIYEGEEMGSKQELAIQDGKVLLNNSPITTYTFKQDYYWMMGDNRHSSEDSRYWGFVPENHIVGKPVFLFFSKDKNASSFKESIRWDRIMTTVGGDGKLFSYKYWVLALLVLYVIGTKIWYSRKQKMNEYE